MEDGYTFTSQGYDATVLETDNPDVYHVQLSEGGAQVFEVDIPITLEGEEVLVDDVIDHAARAAIDMYESEKGTLGQGAEPLEIEAKMKRGQALVKTSDCGCYWMESCNYSEWLMQLKGTPYEQQAIVLLEELIALQAPGATNTELATLKQQISQVQYELDQLNMERLKTAEPPQQILVIQAFKNLRVSFSGLDWVESFLESFKDHRLEPQAILKVKELIDLEAAIDVAGATEYETWDQQDEVRRQMDALLIEKTKSEVDQKLPQSGIEVAPEMANDIADLMEGISFEEPLEPIVARSAQDDKKDPFEVEEFGTELGKGHGDLDPAEVPEDVRISFGPGSYVKLKNEVKVPLWGGASKVISKGTKGWVDSLWDGHGDRYYVRTEDGSLFSVDRDDLSKA
jgi:hypothetical protein